MIAVCAVVLLAAMPRFLALGQPPLTVWDESYYAFDAYSYLGGTPDLTRDGSPRPKIPNERTWEHPPLGKELLVLAIGPLDLNQVGSRLVPAILGTLSVLLLVLIALELSLSLGWACLAGLLLATDGMHIVHSRLAMLDVPATSLALVSILLALVARRERFRGHRWAAAAFAGFAIATKWSIAPLSLLVLSVLAYRQWREPGAAKFRRILAVPLVAGLAYVVSYGPFWSYNGADVAGFLRLQRAMVVKQRSTHHPNPASSKAATWPLLAKPIRYFPIAGHPRGDRELLALGNPVLWWGFLACLPLQAYALVRTRRWQEGVGILGYALVYGPWLFFGRTTYIYYMVPCVPFMALSSVSGIRQLPNRWAKRAGVGFGAASVVAALAFLPMWLYLPLPGYTHYLRWLPTWI